MNELEYRPYRGGDEAKILELFTESFPGRHMSKRYWDWRFRENPTGQTAIELAWDGNTLAGHYAVSPVLISARGAEWMTGLSVTTMVHTSYRKKRVFPALAARLYERLEKEGFAAVWGFPNNNSHRGFVQDLGWSDIYEIPMLSLDLDRLTITDRVSDLVFEVTSFDDRFDALWERARPGYDILVRRDRTYLQWRFWDNPITDYRAICYAGGSDLLGYAVFSSYQETALQIVDLFTVREGNVALTLVLHILQLASRQGYRSVNLWLPVFDPLHLELERLGFVHSGPLTYFGGILLGRFAEQTYALSGRGWHFMMCDSDVF